MKEKREKRKEKSNSLKLKIEKRFKFLTITFLFSFFSLYFSLFAQEVPTTQCQMPRPIPMLECGEAGEFLCVNTPPGSVKENFVIVKGKFNLESSTLSTFSVSVQHEYTRETQNIALAAPIGDNCWAQNLNPQQNFCEEENGKFSVYLPLAQLGPYTILIAASPSQGSAMQKTVRTSFVVVPTFTPDTITFDPALSGALPSGTSHVRVAINLLKDCTGEACDFIGASTGGVSVTVENAMQSQRARNIRCETNVIQGGPGQFSIGVPVQPGANQLKIIVCNAATGFDPTRCPQINAPSFQVGGGASAINILSSSPLRFKISHYVQAACDDSVHVTFNLDSPKAVCPNPQGIYEAAWNPKEGYNIAGIEANIANQKIVKTVMFTSGRILSPFDENGGVAPEADRRLKEAVQLNLPKGLIQETLWPSLQTYLKSPAFEKSLQALTEGAGRGAAPTQVNNEQNVEIPFCPKVGGSDNHLRIKMMKPPQIGKIELGDLKFHAQKLETSIKAKDVSLSVQLYKDVNGDGRPDMDPLPLKIAFKEVELNPSLEVNGSGDTLLATLSSPHTDCDYKRRGACFSMPALFVPQKFKGAANRIGAFAVCDESQAISPRMSEVCDALNVLDRQTGGILQEKVLDTLNRAYACGGSASLTKLLRGGFPIQATLPLLSVEGKIGAEAMQIQESGLSFSLFSLFGSEENFQRWPEALKNNRTGVVVTGGPAVARGTLDIFMPLISQIFWGIQNKNGGPVTGGPFSLRIDEEFFRNQGFDFESRCSGARPETLCAIRPRAKEILGSVVTDYGYIAPDDPVVLTITPSLAFPLRGAVADDHGKIRLELADWDLDVASERGSLMKASLSMKLTLEVSPPIVGPDDPDHLLVKIKVVPAESRVWLVPKEETNTTVIPGDVFFSTLEGTFKFAIDNFSQEGKEIVVPIDRFIHFSDESLFGKLGLKELTWGPNGLDWEWSTSANRLSIHLSPFFQ